MSARILAAVDGLVGLVAGDRTVRRSMVAEYGPTDATLHPELLAFTDAELLAADRRTLIATADGLAEARFRTAEMSSTAAAEAASVARIRQAVAALSAWHIDTADEARQLLATWHRRRALTVAETAEILAHFDTKAATR